MRDPEQILEQLEQASCRRQFKVRNSETDKESVEKQTPEIHSFQKRGRDRVSSKWCPAG